ncbi:MULTISPECIES: hypothetical protein [Paraburkholderia]|jgi:hypothetical protein|uniref:hypothetical protein n=1 Tax=Paraburkholderia TaxID=1822464 RepID=UPI00115F80DC|nr:hypothetical protein [Paraburkholderia hospita]
MAKEPKRLAQQNTTLRMPPQTQKNRPRREGANAKNASAKAKPHRQGMRSDPPNRAHSKKPTPTPGLIPAQTKLHANHLALDFPCNMQKNRHARPARSHLHGTARQHNNEVTV